MDLEQVEAHESRAKTLADLAEKYAAAVPDHPDWEIVVRFYTTLHMVQAYLCAKDQRFEAQRHDQRMRALRESPELAKFGNFLSGYRYLQDVSEQVRYDPGFIVSDAHIEQARKSQLLVKNVVSPKLEKLKGSPKKRR